MWIFHHNLGPANWDWGGRPAELTYFSPWLIPAQSCHKQTNCCCLNRDNDQQRPGGQPLSRHLVSSWGALVSFFDKVMGITTVFCCLALPWFSAFGWSTWWENWLGLTLLRSAVESPLAWHAGLAPVRKLWQQLRDMQKRQSQSQLVRQPAAVFVAVEFWCLSFWVLGRVKVVNSRANRKRKSFFPLLKSRRGTCKKSQLQFPSLTCHSASC